MWKVLLACLGFVAATVMPASGAAATVGFSTLPQGAVLADQLQSQGIVFAPLYGVSGIIGTSPAGNVAAFQYAPGLEFPTFGGRGNFTALHSTVSVHVGVSPGRSTTSMTLTALDPSGNPVGARTESVSPAAGFSTVLAVTSSATNIASFTLVAETGENTSAPVLLDVSFDDVAGDHPDFALDGPASVQVVAGRTATVTISIQRFGSSVGAIDFSLTNLNAGLTATWSPNPGTSSVQLTLAAAPDATPSAQSVLITGAPTVPTAGPAPRTRTIYVYVAAPVTIYGSALIDVSTCSPGGPTGTVTRTYFVTRDPTIAGPLSVSLEGVPGNVQAQVSPPALTFPGGAVGQAVTVTLTVIGGLTVPDTMAALHVTGAGVDQRFAVMLTGTCPRQQMDFVMQGGWLCDNRGSVFPLPHAVVEFFRHRSDWYDDKVGEAVTNDDGSYRVALWASRSGDYYSRLHLDDHLGAHLNTSWDLTFWSIDSEHKSNVSPLVDLGYSMIWSDSGNGTPKCAAWLGAHKAHEEYRATMGSYGPVPDYSIIVWKGFLSPYSSLASTNWPDGFDPADPYDAAGGPDFRNFMVSYHEFGHCIRQSVDGDYTHFTNDASLYTYGRTHGYCGGPAGYVANAGFAFNEGWAEYWSTETGGCLEDRTNTDIEGTVAHDLGRLAACPGVGRSGMMSVLIRAGQNSIHSDSEFRSRYHSDFPGCPLPPVGSGGGTGGGGGCSVATTGPSRIAHGRSRISQARQLAALEEAVSRQLRTSADLQRQYDAAVIAAAEPGRCEKTSCAAVASRIARPAALEGQIALSRALTARYEDELAAMQVGQRGVPSFDPALEFYRRATQLEFDRNRHDIATSALQQAIAALKAAEPGHPDSDLPALRRELERLVALLEARAVVDGTLTTFVALRGADDRDRVKTFASGTRFPEPPLPSAGRRELAVIVLCVGVVLGLGVLWWTRVVRRRRREP